MRFVNDYKKLEVWHFAFDYVKDIYKITDKFPDKERFNLTSQINRAAVSIVSNIAEGSQKKSKRDFSRFLYISLGSIAELDTQLLIAKDFGYFNGENVLIKLEQIRKMIIGLIKSLNRD